MKKLLLLALLFSSWSLAFAQQPITGTVTSPDNQPLPGVNVFVKGTSVGTTTDSNGTFRLAAQEGDIIIFTFIGYSTREQKVGSQSRIDITLTEDISTLETVTIVSNGYEKIPKERATGSFVQLDNGLVNRRVSTNILSRLEDVTSGVIFNRNVEGQNNSISIRGRSTINGNVKPLIVIDNFPYDGDINNINPNDIETVTVLKDAAAASIWGARAGNGVIILTTKNGRKGQPLQVSLNSNVTWGQKPDLFYQSRMSSSDFIDVENLLFNKGFYKSAESSRNHTAISPAVELMIARRDGKISDSDFNNALAALRTQDVRNDYQKYIYQGTANQQYAINLRGSSASNQYFISAGYDNNKEELVRNRNARITLNAGNTWSLLHDKLELGAAVYYVETSRNNNNIGANDIRFRGDAMYPYAKLKDDNGANLPLTKDYRTDFINQAQTNGLLNWQYSPLDEINVSDNTNRLKDFRTNTCLKYNITSHLNAEVLYQYWQSNTQLKNYFSTDTYYARNLINIFSSREAGGKLNYRIPNSGILDRSNQSSSSQNVRAQVNYANVWGAHEFNALGGYEVKEIDTETNNYRYYGYNDELATTQVVDYVSFFPTFVNPASSARIPDRSSIKSLTDRFVSYYANAAYTFNKKYTATFSARKDQSNLFGVRTNQKGVPLWSAGLAWTMTEEPWLVNEWLPYLKLRTTLGYNGNIDKSVTAYTTALSRGADYFTGIPYSKVINPPNPELRWEKVKVWNAGIDFESRNRTITGTIEYYTKWGIDLIGNTPFPPSTGVVSFRGNNANTRSHGMDIVLNTDNLKGRFKWNTTLLYSYLTEKVTTYKSVIPAMYYITGAANDAYSTYPMEGKPLYSVYSFDWAGLSPETGNPQGYVDGVVSEDYSKITNNATPQSIRFNGSARPTSFGAVRNTISWNNISLSFNVSYRLRYYFKTRSVRYSSILSGVVGQGDYAMRWQAPGDETFTHVPSLPSIPDTNRDNFYQNASVLVEKGDHIRFQDINLSYTLNKNVLARLPITRVLFYLYMNNIGILWKATNTNLDPDYPSMKPVRTLAAGVRIDL